MRSFVFSFSLCSMSMPVSRAVSSGSVSVSPSSVLLRNKVAVLDTLGSFQVIGQELGANVRHPLRRHLGPAQNKFSRRGNVQQNNFRLEQPIVIKQDRILREISLTSG